MLAMLGMELQYSHVSNAWHGITVFWGAEECVAKRGQAGNFKILRTYRAGNMKITTDLEVHDFSVHFGYETSALRYSKTAD